MTHASSLDNLPASVRELTGVIGIRAALALVQAFGGTLVKVPKGARADGGTRARLIDLLGEEATRLLILAYGGERIDVPRCAAALRDARDRQIIEDYGAGVPAARLARRERMTERQVRNILKRCPGDPGSGLALLGAQLALF